MGFLKTQHEREDAMKDRLSGEKVSVSIYAVYVCERTPTFCRTSRLASNT